MQAGNHLITNLALAVIAENLVPIAEAPIHWSSLAQMAQPGSILATSTMAKGVYYACIIAAACLPDCDQRLRLVKHRTFTHSLVGVMCLLSALLCLQTLVLSVLLLQHIVSPEVQLLSQMVVIALPLACCFHILGDLITIRGVALFWPKQVYVRLVPKRWCIRNQHWSEYLVVSLLLLATVAGIGLNILGV